MDIQLENIGKKFNNRWIFKDIKFNFQPRGRYAILGANGSGKSTLLQIIAGHHSPSKGAITYSISGKNIAKENIFRHLGLCAPALELPEELSFNELLKFHAGFKKPVVGPGDILSITDLKKDADKPLLHFSSGMKQRVKLALAILFESQLILLDEPASHLDADSHQWYRQILLRYISDRILIIASNDPDEYNMCNSFLRMEEWK